MYYIMNPLHDHVDHIINLATIQRNEYGDTDKALQILKELSDSLTDGTHPKIYEKIIDQSIQWYIADGRKSDAVTVINNTLETVEHISSFQECITKWQESLEKYSKDYIIDYDRGYIYLPKDSLLQTEILLDQVFESIDSHIYVKVDCSPSFMLFYYKNEKNEIRKILISNYSYAYDEDELQKQSFRIRL